LGNPHAKIKLDLYGKKEKKGGSFAFFGPIRCM